MLLILTDTANIADTTDTVNSDCYTLSIDKCSSMLIGIIGSIYLVSIVMD